MDNLDFQCVYDSIAPYLPDGWRQIFFRASYTQGSYGMKFYVQAADGSCVDCFKLPGVSKTQLIRAFMDIDRALAPGRQALPEGKKWSALVVEIQADGDFHASFEYDGEEGHVVSNQLAWEKKFLERA